VITDELEDELRSAFARAAARIEVPEQARQRLIRRNYHPRTAGRRLAARMTAVAGVVAVGAALTVTALVSASHQPSYRPAVQLAAWTVVKQADGDVSVTIRQLRDPAGLQRTLRADGIPASVTFADRENPSCQPYSAGLALLNTVFPPPLVGPPPGNTVIVIRPSALPTSVGVLLGASFGQSSGGMKYAGVEPGLVYATPQCTGS
jgi:hypothetical protein